MKEFTPVFGSGLRLSGISFFFGVGPLLAYLFYYMFTDEVEKGEQK